VKFRVATLGLALSLLALSAPRASPPEVPSYVAKAVADPDRPARHRANDGISKPTELLTLIGIKPGDKIIDVIPGRFWDILFSDIVGPQGQVYLFLPPEYYAAEKPPQPLPTSSVWIRGHNNITWNARPLSKFSNVEPVDIVWMRQNYHDLYTPYWDGGRVADVAAFNKAVYAALKPGGLYVIVDHAAVAGAGTSQTDTLHRIEPTVVKKDVLAAGFVFAGESDALRNPDDPKDKAVFDPSFRGRTDQFVYLFKKPR
jgi:predicted methyltransferase